MTPKRKTALAELRELLIHLAAGPGYHSRQFIDDMRSRSIVCTPFGSYYDETAGCVIGVNGSPPKCILVLNHSGQNPVAIIGAFARRMRTKQAKIVSRFY